MREWRQCRECESAVCEGVPLSSAVASLVCWVGLCWASLFVGLVYTRV